MIGQCQFHQHIEQNILRFCILISGILKTKFQVKFHVKRVELNLFDTKLCLKDARGQHTSTQDVLLSGLKRVLVLYHVNLKTGNTGKL